MMSKRGAHVRALFLILILGSFLAAFLPGVKAYAQEGEPERPVYVIQEGDSLWEIAQRFDVSVDELIRENQLINPGQLAVGDRLAIPGLFGFRGTLSTRQLGYGETLLSLSRRYQVPMETLARLNRVTSPLEFYAGAKLILPETESELAALRRDALQPGQSLLELAIVKDVSVWTLAAANRLQNPAFALPGDVLLSQAGGSDHSAADNLTALPGSSVSQAINPSALPAEISALEILSLPLTQGQAAFILIDGQPGLSLRGSLGDQEIRFFALEAGRFIAFLGVHAMAKPGFYPLVLQGELPGGGGFIFRQAVYVQSGGYAFDPVLAVSPETIDPAVTRPEDAQWNALAAPVTEERLWRGPFRSPAPEIYQDCWPSLFGNRRSYNGSDYAYFHTGLDYCGGVGTEIYSPASGRVVFAGPLTVRGNATMIDHGWGVFSAYMHQSEILVSVGDMVEKDQVIGLVGGTGRVTGPHLHFEIWVGGVQVDPLEWLAQDLP